MRTAHTQFRRFMLAQIASKKAKIHAQAVAGTLDEGGDNDVFTMLVKANEDEAKVKLSDDELVSKMACLFEYTYQILHDERLATYLSCFLPVTVSYLMPCSTNNIVTNAFLSETTAHTLAVALGYLSIYEEVQEEIYEQIISVCGLENDPVNILGSFLSMITMSLCFDRN